MGLNDHDHLLQSFCFTGELDRAVGLLSHMHSPPSSISYIALFRACGNSKSLQLAKLVHAHLFLHRTHIDGLLGEHLVMMLLKCGAIDDACQAFSRLSWRTVLSWTALIAAYSDYGNLVEALKLYQCMQDDGVEPSNYTFVSLFKACGHLRDLEQGKKLHEDARTKGFASDPFVCSAILSMYGLCGAFTDTENTFCEVFHTDIVQWNTMLSFYIKRSQPEKTLQLYRQMQAEIQRANHLTFVLVLQACGILAERGKDYHKKERPIKLICREIARRLHADARKRGYDVHILVKNTLVSVYGKCGAIMDAHGVFLVLSDCAIISWNAMLTGYVGEGEARQSLQLYKQMHVEGTRPNQLTFLLAFQACGVLIENDTGMGMKGCLEIVQALHVDTCLTDYASDIFVGTPLMSMYGKCGSILEAEDVFGALAHRDIVTWTAMMSAYNEQGQGDEALKLYALMQIHGLSPNEWTCVCAFQACAILADTEQVVKNGATLIDTEHVVKNGAVLAHTKQDVNNGVSMGIPLCIGHVLHADLSFRGFALDMHVGTAVLSMYAKCGALEEAETVFSTLLQRDTAAWNAMLTAYTKLRQGLKALLLYKEMQQQRVTLDDGTMVCLLQACGEVGSLETTRQLHFAVVYAGYEQIPSVSATLVDAYGGCGNMVDVCTFSDELCEPDLVFWTACLCGYAGQGEAMASMAMLEKMKVASYEGDEVVLTLVLTSCSHTALVAEGLEYFYLMKEDRSISVNLKHYGILLDLFGRVGDFKRINSILEALPVEANPAIWLCLLGACHMHGNIESAKVAFMCALNLAPKEASAYVLMSNALALQVEDS